MSGKNILLCTLGNSWAVVPEVYAFLAPEQLPLYRAHPNQSELCRMRSEYQLAPPDEIWVCTTDGNVARGGIKSLLQWRGLLQQPPIFRFWVAEGTEDLVTSAQCEYLRELLFRVCLLSCEQANGGQVALSLAGGRKTMSADLQRAGHVFGCHALIHVVLAESPPEILTKNVSPRTFTGELPEAVCRAVMPLVAGRSHRSDLLDVDLDDRGTVTAARFPLPVPADNASILWHAPTTASLISEIRARENAGSQLLGNFVLGLARREHHENWRSLYRLPPRVINTLRGTPLGPELLEWVRVLPKADVHRHVGGCLDIPAQRDVGQAIWSALSTFERHAAQQQVRSLLDHSDWPWNWPDLLRGQVPRPHCAAALLTHVDDPCLHRNLYDSTVPRVALKIRHVRGFAAYERPGELSGSALLLHPAAVEPYAEHVVKQVVAEGLAYVELRGSPQKYTNGDGARFLHAFHTAIRHAVSQVPDDKRPEIRFIIIVNRGKRELSPREVVAMAISAKHALEDFVVGLDLAGDEGQTRPAEIAHDFVGAFEICLPLTIHAGEGESADSIWEAAYCLHADRVGHGLSISDHRQLAARFRDRGICLELCPTSNREVVGFRDPAVGESADCPEYPLPTLWHTGIPLTICTDNPGISRTTLADEYLTAARMAPEGISCWDALAIVRQAFLHAFLPSQDKQKLMKRVDGEVYRSVLNRFSVP